MPKERRPGKGSQLRRPPGSMTQVPSATCRDQSRNTAGGQLFPLRFPLFSGATACADRFRPPAGQTLPLDRTLVRSRRLQGRSGLRVIFLLTSWRSQGTHSPVRSLRICACGLHKWPRWEPDGKGRHSCQGEIRRPPISRAPVRHERTGVFFAFVMVHPGNREAREPRKPARLDSEYCRSWEGPANLW